MSQASSRLQTGANQSNLSKHRILIDTDIGDDIIAVWQRHRPRWHPKLPFFHDPLAIAVLCAPELFHFETMTARVFTRGLFNGWMLPRIIDGPLVHATIDIKAEEAREWIMRRLLNNVI